MSPKFPNVLHDHIRLKGGWDQLTPTLELAPGFVRDALNFECNVTGGYTRIAGYERLDGRAKPSDAAYSLVFISGGLAYTPPSGSVLTDAATGLKTGTVVATGGAGTNSWVAITMRSGAFVAGDIAKVGINTVGTVINATQSIDAATNAQLIGLAAAQYRTLIQPVPGSGAALGYVLYNDVVYAFRANAGGTAVLLYKSSSTGWQLVPFFYEAGFMSGASGSSIPLDGSTLTQGGVSATIKRVVLQSGAWGTNAAGKFIIAAPTGGNFTAGAAVAGTGSFPISLTGAQTAITFATGGVNASKFEFDFGNFSGSAATNRVYGCDGINRCFEFDGTVLVPIDAGTTPDAPRHIAVHKNRLFVGQGASLMFSAAGLPYNWQGASYAGVIGTGETITGMKVLPGSSLTAALLVTSRDNTYMLYGTGAVASILSDWNFVSYNTGSGALDWTVQNMADTYMMDDRGVVTLKTTLNYGNFDTSTLTFQINKFIEQHRTRTTTSTLDRRKSQYRVFFSDGFGLYITIVNGVMMGAMPVYFPTPAYMADEGKFSDGSEASFFCGTDGYLYQLDKGTSFDGAPMNEFFTLKYHSASSPRDLKSYRKAAIEVSGSGYCAFNFGYSLGYGSSQIQQDNYAAYNTNSQMMQWDNFTWDAFVWDGQTVVPNECEMVGTAENVAITIRASSPYVQPYTVNSIILHFMKRRSLR